MKSQVICLLALVRLWSARGIFVGNNRTNRTSAVKAVDHRTPPKHESHHEFLRIPHYAHHQPRMLNGRNGHHHHPNHTEAAPIAAPAEPTNFAAGKVEDVAQTKQALAQQQKEADIKRAATCSEAKRHTLAHKACKRFMRDLCHLGEKGGGELATMEEVVDYCQSFYILRHESRYKEEQMPEYKPPPMPWSNKKKEMPLPEHGYWGPDVEHDDMKTFTGDWQKEFGPRQEGEQNIHEICKGYPDSEWCRIYAHHYGPSYSHSLGNGNVAGASGKSHKGHKASSSHDGSSSHGASSSSSSHDGASSSSSHDGASSSHDGALPGGGVPGDDGASSSHDGALPGPGDDGASSSHDGALPAGWVPGDAQSAARWSTSTSLAAILTFVTAITVVPV